MDRSLAFCLVLCAGAACQAAEPEDLSPELARLLEGSPVPSLAAAAVVKGTVVSAGASGFRKSGSPERVTIDDKYHIGSCTKSMTAVLAAILVEDGTLRWETTPGDLFPDMKIHAGYRSATLSRLLANTGGVPAEIEPGFWAELWEAKGSPSAQRQRLIARLLAAPPGYEPGMGYAYSNGGYAVAGGMLEKAARKAFEDLLRDRLFLPLDLRTAGFRAPARRGRVDQPYGHVLKGRKAIPVDPEPAGDNPVAIAPAGAVHCSILDLARYAQFHLGQAGSGILPASALRALHTPEEGRDYAMGWIVTDRPWAGGPALTHTGSNTMFTAVIWLAPAKGFAAVAACNLGGEEASAACDRAVGLLVKKHLAGS